LFDAFVNPFTVVLFILTVFNIFTRDYPAVIIVSSMEYRLIFPEGG